MNGLRITSKLVILSMALVFRASTLSGENQKGAIMEGTWIGISATVNGKPLPDETVKQLRLTLTKDRYKTERGGELLFDSTYSVHAAKEPKQIDIVGTEGAFTGKTAQGIYALDGDKLRICYTMPGKDRPSAFESAPGSEAFFIVWQRAKPGN